MLRVLIVAETYPFPEHRNGLAKINANLLVPNSTYQAELLCVRDPGAGGDTIQGIYQLPYLPPSSRFNDALSYIANVLPMGTVRAKPYFKAMADFIHANHARFDVIHLSSSYLAGLVTYLSKEAVSKTVLFAIDSVSLFWSRRTRAERNPLKKLVYWQEWQRNQYHEKRFYPSFTRTVFVSQIDAEFAARIAPGARCVSIPNGVDIASFTTDAMATDRAIVFTGDLSYAPNRDAADFLLDEILPRIPTDCSPHLYLVGRRPPSRLAALNLPNVTVTGFVDDIRPYLEKASVYVSPLRYGSGIKNKVLEAMSMARTVVGTPVSFEGIDCIDKLNCIVASSNADDFAANVAAALRSPTMCTKIGKNARRLIEEKYSWESVRTAYGKVYADCAAHR